MADKLSDMKTVSLRALRRDGELLDAAAAGEEILVTRFGKPYVRILPVSQRGVLLGAGLDLGVKQPVSPEPIPPSECQGLR